LNRAYLNYVVSKMVTLFSNFSFGRNFLITILFFTVASSNSLIAEDNASNLPAIKKVKEGFMISAGL